MRGSSAGVKSHSAQGRLIKNILGWTHSSLRYIGVGKYYVVAQDLGHVRLAREGEVKTSTTIALALATVLSGSLAAYAQTEQPTPYHHYHVHRYARSASHRSSPFRSAQPSRSSGAGRGRYDRGPAGGAVWLGSSAYRALSRRQGRRGRTERRRRRLQQGLHRRQHVGLTVRSAARPAARGSFRSEADADADSRVVVLRPGRIDANGRESFLG